MKELDLTRQPPGVGFRPPPEVLIQDYLSPKINGSDQGAIDFIHVVTFFKQDPWELLGLTGIKTREPGDHYFFFSEPDAKYRYGNRVNRKTDTGYWKLTGKDYEIWSEGRLIGKRKILVFHIRDSSNGNKSSKTDWVVHEYHATELDGNNPGQKAFVLCHLFWKSNNGSEGRKGNSSEAGPSKSKQAWASISTASGDEADNHVTGYRTGYTRKNPVAEVTAGQNTSVFCCSFNKYKKSASNKAGSAVSFPTTSKSRLKETKSNLALPSVHAEDSRTVDGCFDTDDSNGTTSDILVVGGDNNVNSFAAENQVTDIEVDLPPPIDMYSGLLRDPLDGNRLNRSTPLPNTPAISYPPTAISFLVAESELPLASVSPALGKEASNHLTRCYSNGMTSNTITPINGNCNSYSAYTAINRVEEEMSGEIGDSNMFGVLPSSNMFDVPPDYAFCVPPELFWLSPLHSQMQYVCMPDCVANDSNYLGDDPPFQYGTNVPAAFSSDLWGP